jgi:hypothetical protein
MRKKLGSSLRKIEATGRNWFDELIEHPSGSSKESLFRLVLVALAVMIGFFAFLLLTRTLLGWDLGTAGDFFGGFVNPLLTFLTFTGVLITIALQQSALVTARNEAAAAEEALKTQSEAADRQNFEATFFQMLSLHNSIVEGMDITKRGEGALAKGRDTFEHFRNTLITQYSQALTSHGIADREMRLAWAYDQFWKYHRQDLGHYFRFLFNMIRFIDESLYSDEKKYIRLVRAQLSDHELVILFYNCVSKYGAKFRKYAVEYALLDNMPSDLLISPDHMDLLPPEVRGGHDD